MRSVVTTFIAILSFTLSSLFAQDTVRVPQDYATIQAAIDSVVANTTIIVSPGIYYEHIVWDRNVNGIKLIGEKGSDSTIIDGNLTDRTFYKQVSAYDLNSLLQGFTIRNGKSFDSNNGPGIYVYGALNFRDVKSMNNKPYVYAQGGGMYLTEYAGTIEKCVVSNNEAKYPQAAYGGGMYLSAQGPVTIIDSKFQNNKSNGTNSSQAGGAYIQNLSNDTLVIIKCVISNNTTSHNTNSIAGGMILSGGPIKMDSCLISYNNTGNSSTGYAGGILSYASWLLVENTSIGGNHSPQGYGMYFNSNNATTNKFINCRFDLNGSDQWTGAAIEVKKKSTALTFINCYITESPGYAIRISSTQTPKCKLTLNHCTVAHNNKGLNLSNTDLVVTNSILWDYAEPLTFSGSHTESIRSSIVKGGFPGGGNLDSDPLFPCYYCVIPMNGSPALGTANPAFAQKNDLWGHVRPLPVNTLPDMGVAEVNQSLTNLHVRFYHDQNENGVRDPDDRFISIGAVKIQNDKSYSNFREQGITIAVQPGALFAEYNEALFSDWDVTSASIYTTTVDSVMFGDTLEFGMAYHSVDPDVRAYITSDRFRCDEFAKMHMTIKNDNSLIDLDTLWLEIDKKMKGYSFLIAPDTIVSENLAGWFLNPLYPGESVTFDGILEVPSISDSVQVGDILTIRSWINNPHNGSLFTYNTELRCSFDPNDKVVNPSRDDNRALISEPLLYTIRFQNTGNDYAQNVSVLDTLDNSIDVSTFDLLHTSHPEHLQVVFEDDHVIRFVFKNIFLSDSITNYEASKGHITYSVKPFDSIETGTLIENNAHIYFDANVPIATNTTVSIMVDKFPGQPDFLVPGRQWIYAHNFYESLSNPLVAQVFETITIKNDTIINGNIYTKLVASENAPCGTFSSTEYMRQDASKIFRLNNAHSGEYLMIDFEETNGYDLLYDNASGTTDTGKVVVDSFGIEFSSNAIPLEVQYLRIYNNQFVDDDAQYKVYRDVGFVQYGILYPEVGTGLCDIPESLELRCFVNGSDTLHFTPYDCFESTLISQTHPPMVNFLNLYPNPVIDYVAMPVHYRLKDICNIHGQLYEAPQTDFIIDLKDLPGGLYFARFVTNDPRVIFIGRFVKL